MIIGSAVPFLDKDDFHRAFRALWELRPPAHWVLRLPCACTVLSPDCRFLFRKRYIGRLGCVYDAVRPVQSAAHGLQRGPLQDSACGSRHLLHILRRCRRALIRCVYCGKLTFGDHQLSAGKIVRGVKRFLRYPRIFTHGRTGRHLAVGCTPDTVRTE